MGMKLGGSLSLSLTEEKFRLCVITGRWGEYLDIIGRKWQETGENCVMWGSVTSMLH